MLLRSGDFDELAGLVEWLWVGSKSDKLPAQAPGAVAVDLTRQGQAHQAATRVFFSVLREKGME